MSVEDCRKERSHFREGRFKKWTVYQAVAKMMLDYLNNSEVLKVNTRELEFHVLAPDEPNVNIEW